MMRCLLVVALGLIGLVTDALAADYDIPTLRGSDTFVPATPTYSRWEGFYAGGQVTYGDANADFSNASDPQTAFALRNSTLIATGISQWQVLGPADTDAAGFGGFVGYNMQWDNAVLGVELNYTHSSFNIVSTSTPISRGNVQASDALYDITILGSGSMKIEDLAVVRGRAGWVVDNFMPYATFGFAVGRADLAVSSTVIAANVTNPTPTPTPACVNPACFFPTNQTKDSAFLYGYSAGAGIEAALTRSIFARVEYEYIQFSPIWQISSHLNITRLGLGVKF